MTTRDIGLALASWLARFLLFATAITTAAVLTFGNPRTIKNALIEVKAYERFVPATIEANKNKSSLPLNDPKLRAIIISSFPAETLRAHSETVIDAHYNWLNRRSPEPTFAVDLRPNVQLLANGVSEYAVDTLTQKPFCSVDPTEIDPFTTPCLPKSIELSQVRQTIQQDIITGNVAIPKPVLTEQDLPKNQAGLTLPQAYPNIPTWYTWAQLAPWLLGLLTILSGVTVVWLSRIKRNGVRQLGGSITSNGIFLCLTPLIFGFLIPLYTRDIQSTFGSSSASVIVNDVSQKMSTELNIWLLIAGLVIAMVGLSVLLLEKATRPSSRYANLRRKSGLISSHAKRSGNGRFELDPSKVPLISSEISITKRKKRKQNKKYRTIPKKEL